MKTRTLLAAATLAIPTFLSGCGSDDEGSSSDTTTGDSGPGGSGGSSGVDPGTDGSRVGFDGSRYEAAIIVRNVTPGGEQHVCVVVELPNTERVWVDEIDASLSGGSHHLIVDRRGADAALSPEPLSCAPTMAGDDTRLMIAQQTETKVALPEGVAWPIEPRQKIFLQLHYLNAGGDVRDIEGKIFLKVAKASAQPIEAKSLFTGQFSINIPAGAPATVESYFVPQAAQGTRHVFALTSHTHKLGVRSTIERVASATAPDSTPIHESTSWDEPPLTQFTPTPLEFKGTDGLRLTCNYQNTTNQAVHFGTATKDEMCFMWVYYYDK